LIGHRDMVLLAADLTSNSGDLRHWNSTAGRRERERERGRERKREWESCQRQPAIFFPEPIVLIECKCIGDARARECNAVIEIIINLESAAGLGMGEKARLDYDHSRKLTTTSLQQQQQGRVERCLLVFRLAAVVADEDLERCRLSLETRNLKETKVQSCCSESRISSTAD